MKRTGQRKRKARKNRRRNPTVISPGVVKQHTKATEASKEVEAMKEVVNDWPLMIAIVLGMACIGAWMPWIEAGILSLFGE